MSWTSCSIVLAVAAQAGVTSDDAAPTATLPEASAPAAVQTPLPAAVEVPAVVSVTPSETAAAPSTTAAPSSAASSTPLTTPKLNR